jgi:Synergist-CTERM protein sorting domain-containing protein
MVQKVHAFTQEDIAKIKNELGLSADPQYVSKFELPVLSTDLSYRNMANVHIDESFVLPDGTVIEIKPEYIVNNLVTIVAPKGLDGLEIFAANKDGGYDLIYQRDPVNPADVLTGGQPPAGAQIVNNKLVWTDLIIGKGTILSDSMLSGYKIAYVTPAAARQGYTLEIEGDKVVANFSSVSAVDGSAEVYLVKSSTDPNAGFDELLLIEFRGRRARIGEDGWEPGCNAVSSLLVLLAVIPFMVIRRRK